jgi:signal transduction histidine kinase/CheY-like chemotaxis protein
VWELTRLPLDLPTWKRHISITPAWLFASRPQSTQDTATFYLADLTIDSQAARDRETTIQTLLQSSEQLWLVMAENCTEQQQITRALAAKNADLVQLNLLKDEFLACISHELKTPLTAILGLSSLLKDQVLGNLNERQVRYAKLIYQSGRHLMAVVNDILDLTRMETGQLELAPGPLQLLPVCTRAIEQAYQQRFPDDSSAADSITRSEIPCSLTLEPGLETMIADEPRLRQMLVNLLSNALKFTDAGGEIKLSVNRWEGWIAFTVSDTGIGIAADKQHLIFQKFQQLENPLTRRFEGTGLGLVITQRLARLHGGDVTFFSREGQGSQFTLLLPPSPPQISFKDRPPQPLETQNNRLVLVVESVPLFIEEMSQQLSGLGYRVVIARSGPDALEKARRLQPCAVLLNPLLPLLSGWDILTLLKSDAETRHIPVVVTATNAEKEQAEKYQADRFLCLPIQSATLQRCLAQVTDTAASSESALASNRLTILYLSSLQATTERSTADKQQSSFDGLSYPGWAIANSLSHLLQLHFARSGHS